MNSKEWIIHGIKVIDIVYISVLYFTAAYALAFFLDVSSGVVYGSDYSGKSTLTLTLEVVSQVAVLTVFAYILRNLVQLIPFPYDGVFGFQHLRVKEVSDGALLTTFATIFFYDLQNKLMFIRKRIYPTSAKNDLGSIPH